MENPADYRIVFSGHLQEGFQPDEVKRTIADQLRLSPQRIQSLFSGKKQVLRHAPTFEKAKHYVERFAQAGLVTTVEREKPAAQRAPTAPRTLPDLNPWSAGRLFRPAMAGVALFELGTVLTWLALTLGLLLVLLHPRLLAGWLFATLPWSPVATALYTLALLIGLSVAALLLKPLLALPRPRAPTVPLAQEQEPDLYDFVADVCEQINVPPPAEILLSNDATLDVRFSADLRAGWGRGQTTLILGLPLLASLNVRQLAAAVAQAMHGWAPRAAPRSAGVTGAIVGWMQRAAHQPDAIDRRLEQWHGKAPRFVEWAQRLIAWSRRPLHLNLSLSQRLAGRLFQRRITRADAAACRLAGTGDFRRMLEQSRVLAFAAGKTLPALTRLWHERGQLPDNIAMAVVAQASHLPGTVHEQLRRQQALQLAQTRSLLPSDSQRLEWLEQTKTSGHYRCASPGAQLFHRFGKLMHDITMRYYHGHLGLAVTSDKLIRTPPKGSQEHEANQRLAACFGAVYADFVPLGLETRFGQMPADLKTAAQHWRLALELAAKEQVKAQTVKASLQEAEGEFIDTSGQALLQRAGHSLPLPVLGNKRNEELDEACNEAEGRYEAALEDMGKAVTPYVSRLATALALLAMPQGQARVAHGARLHAEAEALLDKTAARIEHVYPQLRTLRHHVLLLESLLIQDSARGRRKLHDLIVEKTDDVNRAIKSIELALRSVAFPFATQPKYRNVMHWALRNALPAGGPEAALDRGLDTLQNLALLQRIVVGRLCAISQQVETAIGLKAAAG